MRTKLTQLKKTVVANQTKIVAVTISTLAVVVVAQRAGLKQHDDFLKEKNLYDEFYTPEEI